jgi:iron only hydrogenase large subunit-like protein
MSSHKPNPNKSVNLTINGMPVTVPEGTKILDAARTVGVTIPVLCDHPDLCKRAVCRVCVVECDGRGKLLAACANDVWEGVSVITHNERLAAVRKTIIELILANHPPECLTCIRNTRCTLQRLAEDFGIRESVFRHDALNRTSAAAEHNTLVRDMNKCVKCGRCVEACQEVQTIRCINTAYRSVHYEIGTPYAQSLADGHCVFCGQCAEVCPVGAIYEYDHSAEVRTALNDGERLVAAQIPSTLGTAFDTALGLPSGTITAGKIVTALRRLGFDQVFDADIIVRAVETAENNEVRNRMTNNQSPLPLITGCSAGCFKFIEDFYPDLANRLSPCKNHRQLFGELAHTMHPRQSITAVTISPCIAQKFTHNVSPDDNVVLTVKELARMFTLAGINFDGLPETAFNTVAESAIAGLPETAEKSEVKTITVHGFAQARKVMDSIRKGECDSNMVRIIICSD